MKAFRALVLSGIATLVAHPTSGAEDMAGALRSLGISASLPEPFELTSRTSRKGSELTFSELVGKTSGNARLEAELIFPMDKPAAEALAKKRLLVLEGTYARKPTPYQGEFTNTVSCPPKYLPKREKTRNAALLAEPVTGRLSDRGAWGNCSSEGKASMGTMAFYYDEAGKRLLRLTVIREAKGLTGPQVEKLLSGISFGP